MRRRRAGDSPGSSGARPRSDARTAQRLLKRALDQVHVEHHGLEVVRARHEIVVARAGSVRSESWTHPEGPAIIKLARGPAGELALDRHVDALHDLQAHPVSTDEVLLPDVWVSTRVDGARLTVESALPGALLSTVLPHRPPGTDEACLAGLAALHRRRRSTIDAHDVAAQRRLVQLLVEQPVALLRDRAAAVLDERATSGAAVVEALLAAALRRALVVTRVHGDFSPENILVEHDRPAPIGLIDFEHSMPDTPPEVDLGQYLLTIGRWYGSSVPEVTRALVLGEPAPAPVADLARRVGDASPNGFGLRTTALFGWLSNVTIDHRRSETIPVDWLSRSVRDVLHAVADSTAR